MNKMHSWYSNKESIKVVIMLMLALVLAVVLYHRFSDKDAGDLTYLSSVAHETEVQALSSDESGDRLHRSSEGLVPGRSRSITAPPALDRDIFSFRILGESSIVDAGRSAADQFELNATLIDAGEPLAIIDGEVLGVGATVRGYEVGEIRDGEVSLMKSKHKYIIKMKEE